SCVARTLIGYRNLRTKASLIVIIPKTISYFVVFTLNSESLLDRPAFFPKSLILRFVSKKGLFMLAYLMFYMSQTLTILRSIAPHISCLCYAAALTSTSHYC
ncbi:hypothetical protein L9F63_013872, partial [Diploptera punctata]